MRACETCEHAIYDSVPYGMGNVSLLTDCRIADSLSDEDVNAMENLGYCSKYTSVFIPSDFDDINEVDFDE